MSLFAKRCIYQNQFQVASYLFFKDFIYLFLDTGREKEREGNIDHLPLLCTLTRDQTCNLDMCPDRESNG